MSAVQQIAGKPKYIVMIESWVFYRQSWKNHKNLQSSRLTFTKFSYTLIARSENAKKNLIEGNDVKIYIDDCKWLSDDQAIYLSDS